MLFMQTESPHQFQGGIDAPHLIVETAFDV
jgi:hypothetical protein